jgi:hypothetical protein
MGDGRTYEAGGTHQDATQESATLLWSTKAKQGYCTKDLRLYIPINKYFLIEL